MAHSGFSSFRLRRPRWIRQGHGGLAFRERYIIRGWGWVKSHRGSSLPSKTAWRAQCDTVRTIHCTGNSWYSLGQPRCIGWPDSPSAYNNNGSWCLVLFGWKETDCYTSLSNVLITVPFKLFGFCFWQFCCLYERTSPILSSTSEV